jgi:hypothetical protein
MLQAAGLDGISVSSGFNGSTVCMNATGNNSVAAGTALGNGQFDGVGISVIQNDTSSVFQLQGYAGAPTDTNAVQNFLIGANTLSGANPGDQAYAQLISAGFTSATCATAP